MSAMNEPGRPTDCIRPEDIRPNLRFISYVPGVNRTA